MATTPSTPPRIKKYGNTWPAGWNELDVELHCYRTDRRPEKGGLGAFTHFKQIVNSLWGPHNKAQHFAWHPWADDMLEAALEHRYLGLAGCASSGKSQWAAIWGIVNFIADPAHTTVLVMSTTVKEARKRIWKSVREYWQSVPGLPGDLLDSIGLIRYWDGENKGSDTQGISLMAGEKSAEKDAYNKLIGIKNRRVFLIVDEMTGVSEQILDAATSNLESNFQGAGTGTMFHFLGMGNPSSFYDCFGMFIQPKNGWASINVSLGSWETIYGTCLHFDGEQSPNVIAGKKIYKWMIDQEKLDHYRKTLGENTLRYWRMVRGFFCPSGSEQAVFSEADIAKHGGDRGAVWAGKPISLAALDPSFTNGGDETILFFGQWGMTTDGVEVLLLGEYKQLFEDVTDETEPRNFQIARQVRDQCELKSVPPFHFGSDATGAGDPLADIISQTWGTRKNLRIKFGGAPTERPVSAFNKQPASEVYHNRVTEIWYSGMEFLKNGQLRGITPELAREICQRNLTTTKGNGMKICVESKKEMKGRIGKSPDKADAAMMLVDLVRERFGARNGGKTPKAETRAWQKLGQRADSVQGLALKTGAI